jgi:chromosome segregation ATPase
MRILQYINLFGVLALAGMCVLQWDVNRRLNLRAIDLERSRQEQAQKTSEQDQALHGCQEDLNSFRDRLEKSEASQVETERRLAATIVQREQIAMERDSAITEKNEAIAERDQCKANLDKWAAAVKERDEAIKKASDEITTLSKDRNDAIKKFNDLATRYNGVVKDLNEARAKLAGGH